VPVSRWEGIEAELDVRSLTRDDLPFFHYLAIWLAHQEPNSWPRRSHGHAHGLSSLISSASASCVSGWVNFFSRACWVDGLSVCFFSLTTSTAHNLSGSCSLLSFFFLSPRCYPRLRRFFAYGFAIFLYTFFYRDFFTFFWFFYRRVSFTEWM